MKWKPLKKVKSIEKLSRLDVECTGITLGTTTAIISMIGNAMTVLAVLSTKKKSIRLIWRKAMNKKEIEELSRRFCELTGIKMVEYWWCPKCSEGLSLKNVTFDEKCDTCFSHAVWVEGPDFTDAREVLWIMRERDDWSEFALLRLAIDEITANWAIPQKYMLDTTGLLLREAVEFLEAQSRKTELLNKEESMTEKTLFNSDVSGARQNVPDIVVFGNGDMFRLLCKASSQNEGWMKSTKACELPGGIGCIVQVTTQQKGLDGTYAVAEALTYVPGVKIANDDEFGGRKLVVA